MMVAVQGLTRAVQ